MADITQVLKDFFIFIENLLIHKLQFYMLFRIKFLLILLLAINSELKASLTDSLSNIKPRKNSVFVQFLGDTPMVGVGYNRAIVQLKKTELELGLGVGHSTYAIDRLSLSHRLNFIYGKKKVRLIIGYSGLYENFFFSDKLTYLPSFIFGSRISSNIFSRKIDKDKYYLCVIANPILVTNFSYFLKDSNNIWRRKEITIEPFFGIYLGYKFE